MTAPVPVGLIACKVFEDEIAQLREEARIVREVSLEMGLHDHPDTLRARLQEEVLVMDAVDGIGAVVLAYALCGMGTAGLRAGRHPLVIPRAHDCIAVLMGGKECHARQFAMHPDSYYFSSGWMRAGRTPGPERLESLRVEYAKSFDPDDVEFLLESERAVWASHGRAVFVDQGTPGADGFAEAAQSAARWLGWQYEKIPGDPAMLRDLLAGRWDDGRFQIVPPGGVLRHSSGEGIFRSSAPQE